MIEDDKELQEMQQMELMFKKAYEQHLQYETYVIERRLKFQRMCPHTKTELNEYDDVLNGVTRTIEHCKRCNKLIEVKEKINDLV